MSNIFKPKALKSNQNTFVDPQSSQTREIVCTYLDFLGGDGDSQQNPTRVNADPCAAGMRSFAIHIEIANNEIDRLRGSGVVGGDPRDSDSASACKVAPC